MYSIVVYGGTQSRNTEKGFDSFMSGLSLRAHTKNCPLYRGILLVLRSIRSKRVFHREGPLFGMPFIRGSTVYIECASM